MNNSPADSAKKRQKENRFIYLDQVYLIPKSFLDSKPSVEKLIKETNKVAEDIARHMSDHRDPHRPLYIDEKKLTEYTIDIETIYKLVNRMLARHLKEEFLAYFEHHVKARSKKFVGTVEEYSWCCTRVPIYDENGNYLAPESVFDNVNNIYGDQSDIFTFLDYLNGENSPNCCFCNATATRLDYQYMIPVPFGTDGNRVNYDIPYAFVCDDKLLSLPLNSLDIFDKNCGHDKSMVKWMIERAISFLNKLFDADFNFILEELGKDLTLAITSEEVQAVAKKYSNLICKLLSDNFAERFGLESPRFIDLVRTCNNRGLPIFDKYYNLVDSYQTYKQEQIKDKKFFSRIFNLNK